MRISDWSSDVCSSDLLSEAQVFGRDRRGRAGDPPLQGHEGSFVAETDEQVVAPRRGGGVRALPAQRQRQRGGRGSRRDGTRREVVVEGVRPHVGEDRIVVVEYKSEARRVGEEGVSWVSCR